MNSNRRPHATLRGRPQGGPEGARTTKSIARRLPPELQLNEKYLKFANVHTLLSEMLDRSPDAWRGNSEKTGEVLKKALVKSKERAMDSREDFARYNLLKGFRGVAGNPAALGSFEEWLQAKEDDYVAVASIYADLGYAGRKRLGIGTTQEEVLAACDMLIQQASGDGKPGAVMAFPEIIGSKVPIEGTDKTWGVLEKEMFDCWLQANPEAILPKRGNQELIEALSKAEHEKSALERGTDELENRLAEVTEELRAARIGIESAKVEKQGLRERLRERNAALDSARHRAEELEEKNADLRAINQRKHALMEEYANEAEKTISELSELRSKNAALETRVSDMEGTIAALNAKLEGRDSGEGLTEEDLVRPTLPSEEFFVPDEVQEAAKAPAEEELGKAVEAELPEREITEEISLEGAEQIPSGADEKKERRRLWESAIGMRLEYLLYGFTGNEDLRHPPKAENFENDTAYVRRDRAYRSWCGGAGRSIRKTLEGTRKHWKAVAAGAAGVAVLAAGTAGYFMYAPAQERPEEKAVKEIQKPAVTQVAPVDADTGTGMDTGQKPVKKVEQKPEPLEKPALAELLGKHNLGELGEKTHIVNFYQSMDGVKDAQERYVILEEAVKSEELLKKYERSYSERPVIGMYADFLNVAMQYAELEGQAEAEKSGAREAGKRVAGRLEKLTQQKRIRKKLGRERVSELRDLADQFNSFAANLPTAEKTGAGEEDVVELPVVSPEELEEMKKNGQEPEVPVVILPDKSAGKPFNLEQEMTAAVGADFEVLDTPSKINKFSRKADGIRGLQKRFLVQAHLTGQLVEHEMGLKMSQKRLLFMHIETMNAAILFARAEGQGMTAIAEALNAFELANGEVKKFLGYKRIKKELGKKREASINKNLTWLRNRANELRGKVDAYERNKGAPVPLPGSPSVENGNGAPTAVPEKVQLDRANEYAAIQTLVFSEHGLSILEHPLKVYGQMKGMKINNFDRFILLENLVEKITKEPRWMDGLTKAEQFEMLGILANYLRSAKRAADEPKNWRNGYTRNDIMVSSLAIEVSELLQELRKLKKANVPESRKHLYFPIDQGTFEELGKAVREFDEQLIYEYRQKQRIGNNEGN
ncbi:hypothetical protein GF412_00995 [Candidatus Micrarchaeota archaeon]|nr:hypothetical protein [Candidatus Micrarchaeota archaeon]MBD3417549.1 hypothetical protein [Candidatus Micrarchaeota archaeon]